MTHSNIWNAHCLNIHALTADSITLGDGVVSSTVITGEVIELSNSVAAVCFRLDPEGVFLCNPSGNVTINSSGGTINIGNNAVAQNINIGTGASERVITIGNVTLNSQVDINARNGGINLTTVGSGDITLNSDDQLLIDSDTILQINSSGGVISIGNDAVDQAIQIGAAGARAISVGSASAASLTLEGGVGPILIQADTTIDINAGGQVNINSTGASTNVGNGANVQPVNLATGAAAKPITIGNALSASLDIEGGVGAITMQCDDTLDIDCGSALQINSSGGIIGIGNDAIAQALDIGTGAAARVITFGNAVSTSVSSNGGFIPKSASAAAITGARTLALNDSQGIFSVAKTSAYAITLPTPAQGINYKFLVIDTGENNVTISNGSAHLYGACNVNNTLIAMTGTTITLAASQTIGDWVQIEGIDATHYLVTGCSIGAGGISIA
jgi:hypothetical protein